MEYDPQQPLKGPLPPPRKHNTITNIIVVILSIILMCLIFFGVIAYFNVPHYPTSTNPTGALYFNEISLGNYTGGFISLGNHGDPPNSTRIDLRYVALTIFDNSSGSSKSVLKIYNHATVEVEGGLRCTFEDANGNNKLDIDDKFYVWRAGPEDYLKLVYTKMGGVIAQYNFE